VQINLVASNKSQVVFAKTTIAKQSKGQYMKKGGRLVVEYMEEQLQGERTRGKAARVQQWNQLIVEAWSEGRWQG